MKEIVLMVFIVYNRALPKYLKTGIDGKEQIIRFAKKGEIIGFRSVLSKELACTTAEVLEDCISCYIPSETLIDLIKSNGNFAVELLQLTCRELGEANSFITDIAQKTVRERLAEILVHLQQEFGNRRRICFANFINTRRTGKYSWNRYRICHSTSF
jgi:CRP-like cAMP-binding protein